MVCYNDGRVEPLNVHDLVATLAAESTSGELGLQPWIVDKAVESLVRYFREEGRRDRVTLAEFTQTAQVLLASFFKEVTRHESNGQQLDLFAAARCCGPGFELEFFREIRSFLDRELKEPARQS